MTRNKKIGEELNVKKDWPYGRIFYSYCNPKCYWQTLETSKGLEVSVTQPNGKVELHRTGSYIMYGLSENPATHTIMPDEEIGLYVPMHTTCKQKFGEKTIFSEPGEYRINATYSLSYDHDVIWTGEVKAKELTLTVTQPNEIDQAALSIFQKSSLNIGIIVDNRVTALSLEKTEEYLDLLRQFIDLYPGSTYAPYAQFWLTLANHRSIFSLSLKYEEAHEVSLELQKILNCYPEFSYTNIIKCYLAISLFKTGNYQESLNFFEEVRMESVFLRQCGVQIYDSCIAECYYPVRLP